jgi:hypothetical protein
MLLRRWQIASFAVGLLVAGVLARPQDFDRDKSAREYVQFLVLQLQQWNNEFPQQFYAASMKPPVDVSKMSEAAKAGPAELSDAVKKLAALSSVPDLLTNPQFRRQLEKTLDVMKETNHAMSVQRFPAVLQNSWDQVRLILNNLARVYKVEMLAVLDPPGGGGGGRGGRGGRGPAGGATIATGPVPGGIAGYIVDLSCAKRGKGMWTNAECVARCVRDGDKVVLVTDDGKIFQIANPDKVVPESYGQVVTLMGKTDGDTITVEHLKQ